ncbi:putative F-box protein At3g10240 [Rutidosis leptorrhynchoides]|uniref:putative F-box protein At3g10240 n=1 Tax=Rutidosis leptorrhynchoides TaxID=125765 RepID=UPI003A99FA72
MENERILSITKGPNSESVIGNTSSIHDLSDYHIVEILLGLPVKTIIGCKCVCRDWLNLISDSHFINLHLTKSPECFMLLDHEFTMDSMPKPKYLRLLGIQEEHGCNHLHHDPIMSLDLNLAPVFQDSRPFAVWSVNGLICLIASGYKSVMIFICSPITREYMILPKQIDSTEDNILNCYGFGVSSLTGEYKVLRVFQDVGSSIRVLYAEIYTLGSGKWRSLAPCNVTYSIYGRRGTFLNNHVHWNIDDNIKKICRFNVDKETFDVLPYPPVVGLEDTYFNLGVRNDDAGVTVNLNE